MITMCLRLISSSHLLRIGKITMKTCDEEFARIDNLPRHQMLAKAEFQDTRSPQAESRIVNELVGDERDVYKVSEAGEDDDGFADDFLNMMGGGGLLRGPQPAYTKFSGEMMEAFNILTDSMTKKGDQNLITHGKFKQTYSEGADELKQATSFDATDYNTAIADQLKKDLGDTVKADTPQNIERQMKEMVDICSNYLAQHAEHSKDKGLAFKLLVKQMKAKGSAPLYKLERASHTFASAANELQKAKGLDSDHDDPNLSQQIHSALSKTVESVTPDDLKQDMKDTVDQCSKYLSQAAVDQNERGPAFDTLIRELEKNGGDNFAPQYASVGNKFAAAHVLKSAPGLTSVKPDPQTMPEFKKLLHHAVDSATPKSLGGEMNGVIDRSAGYLSAYVRDRGPAMQLLLKTMKSKPTTEFAKRGSYALDYGTGAMEVETAPAIVPYLPVKDIADEGKQKLTADVENTTPAELKTAMKSAVQDVSQYLSQPVALRSGAAGDRYPQNYLTSVMKSLGKRPLFKHKGYGQTYADGAEALKYAGPLEHDPKAEELQHKIATEITHGGMPLRLAPTITKTLEGTINEGSKHLAKLGNEKAVALDHLVKQLKDKGDAPLAQMQGYMQTHADAARRIENAPSLENDKVDKGVYEVVKGKLTQLITEHPPSAEHQKNMPGVIDDSSKFLASPVPETTGEKRQILADLMAREGDKILGQDGIYKMTYKEGGEEVKLAPVGITKAIDPAKKKEISDKIEKVIPNKQLQRALKEPVDEGSAHISDSIKGRGEAMKFTHDSLKKEKDKEFLKVGSFKKNHAEAAGMLEQAPKFSGQDPSPVIADAVRGRLDVLNKDGASDLAKKHMDDTLGIATHYIAGVATKDSGLDAKALAALAESGGLGGPSPRHPGETDEEYRQRLAVEASLSRRPGESEEEYQKRVAAAGRLPGESEEEYRKRIAAAGRLPGESEEEYRKRIAAAGRLPGESEEEYRKRIAAAGRLPGESEEEYRKRIIAAGRLPGESEEEFRKRVAAAGRLPGESEEEYRKRIAAAGRLPGESEEEYRKRIAAAGRLPGESEEEYRKRIIAAGRLPGESEEEFRKRVAAAGRLPGESEEEYRKRIAAAGRLPGESEEEYRKRIIAAGRLPGESEEEFRKRIAAAGRLPGESEEEYRKRVATAGRLPGESEEEYRKRIIAAGRLPGESEEEFRKRIAAAGRLPGESEEEYRKRVAAAGRLPGESEEEYRKRIAAAGRLPGESEEEYRKRIIAAGRLPGESEEEFRKRIAAAGRLPGESEEEYRKRVATAGRLPGESEEEYRKRIIAAGRLPGESEEEFRKRIAAAGRLPGESEEEYRKRVATAGRLPGESEEEYRKRIAAAGRLPGESEEEYRKRIAAAGRLPGESEEEYRKRLAAAGRLPGESEEEYRKRIAAAGRLPGESEEEFRKRIAAAGRLPGESEEEYRKRIAAAGRLPGESEEEYRKRIAAAGRLPGESEEEYRKRIVAAGRLPGESEEEFRKRIAAAGRLPGESEEEYRKRMAAGGRLPGETEEEYRKRMAGMYGAVNEQEREAALKILHAQLNAKGNEMLYKQPLTEVTHAQASAWLKEPPMKVDKTVKESGDTARLSKKFERKLGNLVAKATPPDMHDAMQDVVIESARILSEHFVANNYKAQAREGLISAMQERRNEILVELDGATETSFFAAQRLKKAKSLDVKEPCDQVAYYLTSKMGEIARRKSMPRKVTPTMKEHVKDAAHYLSEHVTKPDDHIEAYVALLEEMEANGDSLLIEGDIPKSYKDSAAYLRQLTSFEDRIKKSNPSLQSSTEAKLKHIMANVPPRGYSLATLDGVIKESAGLLVSYIMLQGEKTEAMKCLIEKMQEAGPNVLLRHGNIRKNYEDGAEALRGKNADQLSVEGADPVVSRKILIKLNNLMLPCTPAKFQNIMDAVIEEATMYLAVNLLETHVIKVCKCMKNVCVQCELWCEEILRRVARPGCTCSRHQVGSAPAATASLQFELRPCPATSATVTGPCPAPRPTFGCAQSATFFTYTSFGWNSPPQRQSPSRHSPSVYASACASGRGREASPVSLRRERDSSPGSTRRDLCDVAAAPTPTPTSTLTPEPEPSPDSPPQPSQIPHWPDDSDSFQSPESLTGAFSTDAPFWQTPTTMLAHVHTSRDFSRRCRRDALSLLPSKQSTRTKSVYSSTRTPIISTDQMCDWHAMMISLMWNVQAWRDWIQENIDRALAYQPNPNIDTGDFDENWLGFQRRVTTEALQWRQYNIFSRQLTLRLSLRYRDTMIVSPTRATNRTQTYLECQQEMLEIIDMFNRWTQWLTAVIKETNSLQSSDTEIPLHEFRWLHFKKNVKEYSEDWNKYNNHLKVCWENKYRTLIAEWLPGWKQPGPVWVVSACGAVPSGAVAAGVHDNELIWVARTTHRCNVLPAALHPSKHSCIAYADGGVHHYTKYQVMCNAEASWVAWRAGSVTGRAVRVTQGVYVGRVHYRSGHLVGAVHAPYYRCHVVIFGRPFAFNCYELLVLDGGDA